MLFLIDKNVAMFHFVKFVVVDLAIYMSVLLRILIVFIFVVVVVVSFYIFTPLVG